MVLPNLIHWEDSMAYKTLLKQIKGLCLEFVKILEKQNTNTLNPNTKHALLSSFIDWNSYTAIKYYQ